MGSKFSIKQENNIKTGKNCINQVIQLSNGKLATSSSDNGIDIYNLKKYELENSLSGYNSPVKCIINMNDGRFATGSVDGSIKIWTCDKTNCDLVIMAHEAPINTLIQLKDGNLASGSEDNIVKIYDLNKNWFIHTFKGHTKPVKSLVQLNDGRIVSGSKDKAIIVYNLEGKDKIIEGGIKVGHKATSLLIANKSGLLLVGAKAIRVFDMSKKEEYNNIYNLSGHHNNIHKMVNIGNDGIRIITAAKHTIKIWNLINKSLEKQIEGHKGETFGLDILSDGRLITGGGDGEIKIWNVVGEKGEKINLKIGGNNKENEEIINE